MRNKTLDLIRQVITFLLVLLWIYTATSKLSELNEFEKQLNKQNFSPNRSAILLWAVPMAELVTALLLTIKKTRLIGLFSSIGLMILFTGYVALVLIGFYKHVPCSCGGVIKKMGWQLHFWFNVFFLLVAGFGAWLEKRHDARKKKT